MSDPERTSAEPGAPAADPAASTDPGRTFAAPSMPAAPADAADEWACGRQVGDFVLVQVLGKGSFGTVYLARQVSLERSVALKVTATRAASHGEGLALAGLEHDHIVKVYAEFSDARSGKHCLVLQYVPGADLAAVIRAVHGRGVAPETGQTLLAAIDTHVRGEARFDPRAARDREELAGDDFAQAVCRFGGQLAGALAFAHARGVLHCDVKPANVLVTPYGRPMLADFNVSFDRARRGPDDSGVGGTLAYMAPEHRAAVYGEEDGRVDERSDVYSLGVVLHELTTGRLPKADDPAALDRVPRELAAVVRRCLDPDPAKRYPSATELADAVAAARALLGARRALPPPDRVGRWVVRRPFVALSAFAVLPHVAGSVLNIAYNAVKIDLTPDQQAAFLRVTLAYNLIAYPVGLWVCWQVLSAVVDGFGRLPRTDGPAADALRRRVLNLGYWAVGIAAAGWLPGAVAFPLGIDLLSDDRVPAAVYAHYAVSFTLSALVGIVFSYLGVQYVVLRALYPAVGNPDRFTPALAREELRGPAALFGPFVVLASAVPLAGAVLLVAFAEGEMTLGFRLLVAGLIGFGVAGVAIAERVSRALARLAGVGPDAG